MHPKLQQLLPQVACTRLYGRLATIETAPVKNFFIWLFLQLYDVKLDECEISQPYDFKNFQEFFIRKLKPEARSLELGPSTVLSPADGNLSEFGQLNQGRLVQAKGQTYTVTDLVGAHADDFSEAHYATVYLAPNNYHRVHMPVAGTLEQMDYVPGKLFSVNPKTAAKVPLLLAKNERVICRFRTEHGPMLLVLIGALNVASIITSWHGSVNYAHQKTSEHYDYRDQNIHLQQGQELGYFAFGSTVVMLLPTASGNFAFENTLASTAPILMGQTLGRYGENSG